MVDFNYLNGLIDETNNLYKNIEFTEIDILSCSFSYMPRKKTAFVGYKQGYYDHLIRAEKGMKESDKLRSITKNYLIFIKNKDGELIRIEVFTDGVLDVIFQVHRIEGKRYLFPFSTDGENYPTCIYVTRYDGNTVTEEYMVEGNQIVHEKYTQMSDAETIEYSRINYISGGKSLVLEVSEGKLRLNPLSYEEVYRDSWFNH